MTNTVTIDGQKVSAFDAIIWANENIGRDTFDMQHQFPGWHWRFTFKNSKQAIHFALKWAQ